MACIRCRVTDNCSPEYLIIFPVYRGNKSGHCTHVDNLHSTITLHNDELSVLMRMRPGVYMYKFAINWRELLPRTRIYYIYVPRARYRPAP